MQVVPFKAEHLEQIKLQSQQGGVLDMLGPDQAKFIEQSDISFSAVDGDEVIACAGILPLWPGRGHAWALLSGNIGTRFVRVHRAVSRAIAISGYRRIEMAVDENFPQALQWAQMLGFVDETPNGMPGYYDDGRLYHQFARVK